MENMRIWRGFGEKTWDVYTSYYSGYTTMLDKTEFGIARTARCRFIESGATVFRRFLKIQIPITVERCGVGQSFYVSRFFAVQ